MVLMDFEMRNLSLNLNDVFKYALIEEVDNSLDFVLHSWTGDLGQIMNVEYRASGLE
jgi:hypothetical protein